MAKKDIGLKGLKEALDESSRHNRRLLLFFLLFLVYALVTVTSTTDLQLLIPDGKVSLKLAHRCEDGDYLSKCV
jgi:hypothetical protein